MRITVKLPQIMPFLVYLFTHGFSPKETCEVGRGEQVSYLFPRICLQAPSMEVRGKWGRGCLNYLDAQ